MDDARRPTQWSETMPETGIGDAMALDRVRAHVEDGSARLGAPDALAHMDPAPAGIAASLAGLSAQMNQNLLHPDLSPVATEAERRVVGWIAPAFAMASGHMCAGSTLANLTALWCAREHGARRVVTSAEAHVSVAKSANILGLPCESVPVDARGALDRTRLGPLDDAALVLTAGTTGRGAIDALARDGAAWLHVDAAWAGPLRFTCHGARLDGIEGADSVAISAHKWLFQPKESALVLFREPDMDRAVSFGADYLAAPNVGVQGSRGAASVALLGTLLAWGRAGLARRIEGCVALAEDLAARLAGDPRAELLQRPETGVVNWRPAGGALEQVAAALRGVASETRIDGAPWLRQVAANLAADPDAVWARIDRALGPGP